MPAREKKKHHSSGNKKKDKLKSLESRPLVEDGLPAAQTLLDLRGSVPVPNHQDLEAIRKQVRQIRHNQNDRDSKENNHENYQT